MAAVVCAARGMRVQQGRQTPRRPSVRRASTRWRVPGRARTVRLECTGPQRVFRRLRAPGPAPLESTPLPLPPIAATARRGSTAAAPGRGPAPCVPSTPPHPPWVRRRAWRSAPSWASCRSRKSVIQVHCDRALSRGAGVDFEGLQVLCAKCAVTSSRANVTLPSAPVAVVALPSAGVVVVSLESASSLYVGELFVAVAN
jgi:hypothetical protein